MSIEGNTDCIGADSFRLHHALWATLEDMHCIHRRRLYVVPTLLQYVHVYVLQYMKAQKDFLHKSIPKLIGKAHGSASGKPSFSGDNRANLASVPLLLNKCVCDTS